MRKKEKSYLWKIRWVTGFQRRLYGILLMTVSYTHLKSVKNKVAIVTDSNSGITQSQANELGIFVLPMPFYINEELFYEDITLSQKEFYEKLAEDANISTSQPTPVDVMELWEKLLLEAEEIVHIPMSSGLSNCLLYTSKQQTLTWSLTPHWYVVCLTIQDRFLRFPLTVLQAA